MESAREAFENQAEHDFDLSAYSNGDYRHPRTHRAWDLFLAGMRYGARLAGEVVRRAADGETFDVAEAAGKGA